MGSSSVGTHHRGGFLKYKDRLYIDLDLSPGVRPADMKRVLIAISRLESPFFYELVRTLDETFLRNP